MFYAHGYDEGSKITRIAQWEHVEKTSGHKPEKLLNKPILQDDLVYLWEIYLEINSGCDNIGYIELDAYQRVTGTLLDNWEAGLMLQIDFIRRKQ